MLVWACIGDERVNVSGWAVNAQAWTKSLFCLYLTLDQNADDICCLCLAGSQQAACQASSSCHAVVCGDAAGCADGGITKAEEGKEVRGRVGYD